MLNVTCHAVSRVPVWCSVTCHVSRRCSSLQQPRSATDSRLLCAVPAGLGWAGLGWAGLGCLRHKADSDNTPPSGAPSCHRPPSSQPGPAVRGPGRTAPHREPTANLHQRRVASVSQIRESWAGAGATAVCKLVRRSSAADSAARRRLCT